MELDALVHLQNLPSEWSFYKSVPHSWYMMIPGLRWNWTIIRLPGCSSLSVLRTKDGCLSCMVLKVSFHRDVSIQSSCQACCSSVCSSLHWFWNATTDKWLIYTSRAHSSFLLLLLLWNNRKGIFQHPPTGGTQELTLLFHLTHKHRKLQL